MKFTSFHCDRCDEEIRRVEGSAVNGEHSYRLSERIHTVDDFPADAEEETRRHLCQRCSAQHQAFMRGEFPTCDCAAIAERARDERPECDSCGAEIPIGGEGHPEICPACLRVERIEETEKALNAERGRAARLSIALESVRRGTTVPCLVTGRADQHCGGCLGCEVQKERIRDAETRLRLRDEQRELEALRSVCYRMRGEMRNVAWPSGGLVAGWAAELEEAVPPSLLDTSGTMSKHSPSRPEAEPSVRNDSVPLEADSRSRLVGVGDADDGGRSCEHDEFRLFELHARPGTHEEERVGCWCPECGAIDLGDGWEHPKR